jgi:hypothetical protein
VIKRVVGVQTREEVEQCEPAAQKEPLFRSAELAAIESGYFLKPRRSLSLRLWKQIAKPRRARLAVSLRPQLSRVLRVEKCAHFQTQCFANQGRHGVSDDAKLVRARDREAKPIGKALDACRFTGSE